MDAFGGRIGEAAALGTAACWSGSACFFAAATRRIPAQRVNLMRLLLACVLLSATLALRSAFGLSDTMPTGRQSMFLLASGVIGLGIGDVALFRAWTVLDARRVALVGASAPIFVLLLAVPLLGERLGPSAFAGMALTLGGIAWVLAERSPKSAASLEPSGESAPPGPVQRPGHVREGVLLALVAAIGQAAGFVIGKAGLGHASPDAWLGQLAAGDGPPVEVSPLAGTAVRMVAGTIVIAAWVVATGALAGIHTSWRAKGAGLVLGGTICGPFIGVWLSLVAVAHTDAAVAQTLMALQPVLVLPLAHRFLGEKVTARAVLGAVVAVAGVAVLAFRVELDALLLR